MASAVSRLGSTTNLVHGFIYFAPEAAEHYAALGVEGRAQYFGSRAAAMGPVSAGVVEATFFNFNPALVSDAIPAAWAAARPERLQQARLAAATDVLRRIDVELSAAEMAEATDLAQRIVDGSFFAGRPLAAANREVPLPDDPWGRLWQLITVIREWRGDAHVAALVASDLGPIEALVLHACTGQVDAATLQSSRGWDDASWAAGVERLRQRGMVQQDEVAFTDGGRRFREGVESMTDRASQRLVDTIGEADTHRLCDLLRPVRDALLQAGAFPFRKR